MEFSRQEHWGGLPFPSTGDLPQPGIEPGSPALQTDSLASEPPGKCLLSGEGGIKWQQSWSVWWGRSESFTPVPERPALSSSFWGHRVLSHLVRHVREARRRDVRRIIEGNEKVWHSEKSMSLKTRKLILILLLTSFKNLDRLLNLCLTFFKFKTQGYIKRFVPSPPVPKSQNSTKPITSLLKSQPRQHSQNTMCLFLKVLCVQWNLNITLTLIVYHVFITVEVINWCNLWKTILHADQKYFLKPWPMTHLIVEMFISHWKTESKQYVHHRQTTQLSCLHSGDLK